MPHWVHERSSMVSEEEEGEEEQRSQAQTQTQTQTQIAGRYIKTRNTKKKSRNHTHAIPNAPHQYIYNIKEEKERKARRGVPTQSPKVQMERMSQESPVAISEFLTVRMSHCTPA